MSNKEILFYVIKILVVLAQTSDMPQILKDIRVSRLSELAKEVWMND